MDDQIARMTEQLRRRPPPAPGLLDQVQATLRIQFPADYAAFMRESNGAEGWIGGAYLSLWSLEDILSAQEELAVDEFLPDACPIGSDGGGEAYALDRRSTPMAFLEIPFVPLDIKEARICGHSFQEFLQFLYDRTE